MVELENVKANQKGEIEAKTALDLWIDSYARHLKKAGIVIRPKPWIGMSIGLSFIVFVLVSIVSLEFGLILGILILDLMLGIPYYISLGKIAALEEDLPDALRQMSTTFRAGGTYEYALKEVAIAEYKELSPEMTIVLKEVQGGANLTQALQNFADRTDSRLVKRSIAILIDATKSGAPLADVFNELSEDIQSLHYIAKQRQAKTLMQMLFIGMAGGLVAPLIFGMVTQIIAFLILVGVRTLPPDQAGVELTALAASAHLTFLMKFYIFAETLASAAMMSSMRTGKFTNTIIYFPVMLFIAFTAFYIGLFAMQSLLGGVESGTFGAR